MLLFFIAFSIAFFTLEEALFVFRTMDTVLWLLADAYCLLSKENGHQQKKKQIIYIGFVIRGLTMRNTKGFHTYINIKGYIWGILNFKFLSFR